MLKILFTTLSFTLNGASGAPECLLREQGSMQKLREELPYTFLMTSCAF